MPIFGRANFVEAKDLKMTMDVIKGALWQNVLHVIDSNIATIVHFKEDCRAYSVA